MGDHITDYEAKFLQQWGVKRNNKRKIYLQHFLLWGILISTFAYFFSIDFSLEAFESTDYILRLIFWSLGSQLYALVKIRSQEKQYKRLTQQQNPED